MVITIDILARDNVTLDRPIAYCFGGSCPAVRPTVCHTCDLRLNGSRYDMKTYFAPHDKAMVHF